MTSARYEELRANAEQGDLISMTDVIECLDEIDRLRHAGKNWVRAEYLFRAGTDPYSPRTQNLYIMAETRLREALSGQKSLDDAAEALGVSTPVRKKMLRRKGDGRGFSGSLFGKDK